MQALSQINLNQRQMKITDLFIIITIIADKAHNYILIYAQCKQNIAI